MQLHESQNLQNALNEELHRWEIGKNPSKGTNLVYPVAKLRGYDVHLGRNFFGVLQEGDNATNPLLNEVFRRHAGLIIHTSDQDVDRVKLVTPILHVEVRDPVS